MSLRGRVALVTGANHGIGAATAEALARLGADVAVTFLRLLETDDDPERPRAYALQRGQTADATLASIDDAGVRGHAVELDLADPTSPGRLFDEVESALGPVSVLVHNASGWRRDSFAPDVADHLGRQTERVNADTIDAQLHVDARAGALLIAEFADRHRDRDDDWGRIVTLTSGGPSGFPGEASYGAAKAALENFTMTASIELASLGITANVVHPPVTDTGWITEQVRRFVSQSPEHVHIAAPDQVGGAIAWLCTTDAQLVTGNIIRLR